MLVSLTGGFLIEWRHTTRHWVGLLFDKNNNRFQKNQVIIGKNFLSEFKLTDIKNVECKKKNNSLFELAINLAIEKRIYFYTTPNKEEALDYCQAISEFCGTNILEIIEEKNRAKRIAENPGYIRVLKNLRRVTLIFLLVYLIICIYFAAASFSFDDIFIDNLYLNLMIFTITTVLCLVIFFSFISLYFVKYLGLDKKFNFQTIFAFVGVLIVGIVFLVATWKFYNTLDWWGAIIFFAGSATFGIVSCIFGAMFVGLAVYLAE